MGNHSESVEGTLYTFVQGIMADQGLTQSEVVRRSGLERGIFSRMRDGRDLSHRAVQGLAEALHIREADILLRLGYRPEGLGATVTADPSLLGNEELLSEVRARMRPDPHPDTHDLESTVTPSPIEPGHQERGRRPTGRRRTPLGADQLGTTGAGASSA
ncbi:helix-turn-helix domain-containing protein [Pseudonocardia hispaniensis]|uniref:Helix-turn-helix domain-containing protein n=1 Tax=Pseudonocardia hispaniensis TaxID=904933 RepID=A0ABW1IWM9_9PSEU